MKFKASGGEDFAPVPAGSHVGICTGVVDLGVQPGSGQYPDPKHQVHIRFELPAERITYTKDGQKVEGPMTIGRTFTASMGSKANLRKFVEGWRGAIFTDAQAEDFDFANLLGKRCLLNVTHQERNGKTYANIGGAMPIPKGMKSEEQQHNASLFYSLDKPDDKAFNALTPWFKKKISERIVQEQHDSDPGYAREDEAVASVDPDDDIPF